MAADLVGEGPAVQDLDADRLLKSALDSAFGEDGGQVGEGPRDGGDGYSVLDRDVGGGEGGRAVDLDAAVSPTPAVGNGDLDQGLIGAAYLVQGGRRAMGEGGPGTAGQNGGQEAPAAREELRGDQGVDPAVDAVKLSPGRTLANGRPRQANLAELIQLEHKVLAPGEVIELSLVN
jgi:hypothetical protein